MGIFTHDILQGGLLLSVPLFSGGKVVSEVRAAKLLQQAALHRLSQSKGELIFNVTSLFYSILGQRRLRNALLFSVKTMKKQRSLLAASIAQQKTAAVDLYIVQQKRAQRRFVKIGIVQQNRVQILSGLEAGERVVIAGNEKIKKGVRVRIAGIPKGKGAPGKRGKGRKQ